jgi:putative copper export protein
MEFSNLWNQVMLIKHIFVAVLIILAIYAFEVIAPKVSRLAAKGPSPELGNLQKLQLNIALTGFVLGIIILLLTSVAAAI